MTGTDRELAEKMLRRPTGSLVLNTSTPYERALARALLSALDRVAVLEARTEQAEKEARRALEHFSADVDPRIRRLAAASLARLAAVPASTERNTDG